MFKAGGKGLHRIVVTIGANGQELPMEVDTGAAVSVISDATQTIPQVPTGQHFSHTDHLHRRADACARTDEGGGELPETECQTDLEGWDGSNSSPKGAVFGVHLLETSWETKLSHKCTSKKVVVVGVMGWILSHYCTFVTVIFQKEAIYHIICCNIRENC